jgi:potassium channel subfamily K protein
MVDPEAPMDYSDAVYFIGVTISSMGYGDILPVSVGARLFTIMFGGTGIAMMMSLSSEIAAFLYKVGKLCSHRARKRYISRTGKELTGWRRTLFGTSTFVSFGFASFFFSSAILLKIVETYAPLLGESVSRNEWTYFETIYFCWASYATICYGDLVPHTKAGRVVVGFSCFIGLCLFGYILTRASNVDFKGESKGMNEITSGLDISLRIEQIVEERYFLDSKISLST